jgi:hypothetical protein
VNLLSLGASAGVGAPLLELRFVVPAAANAMSMAAEVVRTSRSTQFTAGTTRTCSAGLHRDCSDQSGAGERLMRDVAQVGARHFQRASSVNRAPHLLRQPLDTLFLLQRLL